MDQFVVYDDVQYINKGWINRNRILSAGADKMFTVPLVKAPREALIHQRTISPAWGSERERFIKMIRHAYSKAPFFESCFELVSDLVGGDEHNLSEYVVRSMKGVAGYLGIETPMINSKNLGLGCDSSGEERILEICDKLGATAYVNAIGGRDLYHVDLFAERNIMLSFLQSETIVYPQFGRDFVPWLSIIDVMMFNSAERVREFIRAYKLVL